MHVDTAISPRIPVEGAEVSDDQAVPPASLLLPPGPQVSPLHIRDASEKTALLVVTWTLEQTHSTLHIRKCVIVTSHTDVNFRPCRWSWTEVD